MSNSRAANNDFVIAYKYQTSYKHELPGYIAYRDEYFIPDVKICFNKHLIFKSVTPFNLDYSGPTILKKVILEKSFVDAIINALGDNESTNYIFATEIVIQELLNDFIANENNFEQNYKLYGSFILPNFIIQYITDTNFKNSRIKKLIFDIIASLDEIEKESLEICLREKIRKIVKPFSLVTEFASMAVGVTTGVITDSMPVGILACGFVLFGKKKYEEYIKNRCDEFKVDIFKALKPDQKVPISDPSK